MDVTVNAAVSADGKLSSRQREQILISGPEDFDRVDRLRAETDAVLVGVGTVLADDPHLVLDDAERREHRRDEGRSPNPARVVADSNARTPPDARVLDDEAATYLLVSAAAPDDRAAALREAGATVVAAGEERTDLDAGLSALETDHGIRRLMVEGGGEIVYSLFAADLVDHLSVYVGSLVIGGRDAPTLVDGEGFVDAFPRPTLADVSRLDDGVLLEYEF